MPNPTRPSMKDIADKLHISLATVHKALAGKPGVSEVRRQQVVSAAREMGYVANTAAQSLARKDINLGILMPSMWQEYFSDMRAGILSRIDALRGHSKINGIFRYLSSEADCEGIRAWAQEMSIDAILYCPSMDSINRAAADALKDMKLPIFCVGEGLDGVSSAADIFIDAALSGRLAADFLKCTHPTGLEAAIFTGSLKVASHRIKADAFCSRISDGGGMVAAVIETHDDAATAEAEIARLLQSRPNVNGIYVSTSTSEPICRYIDRHLRGRVTLIGTDIFDALKDYMKSGVMHATICQNQELVGQSAVTRAYEHLSKFSSYKSGSEADGRILIRPTLLLCANIE